MGKVDLCCCCGKEMPDIKEHSYVNFRYQVPTLDLAEAVLVAVVCQSCAVEANSPNLFPVVEAFINARVIRIEHPEMVFTPRES